MKKQTWRNRNSQKRVLAAVLTLLLIFTTTVTTNAMEVGEAAAEAVGTETTVPEAAIPSSAEELTETTNAPEEEKTETLQTESEKDSEEVPELSEAVYGETTYTENQTLTADRTIQGDVVLKANMNLAGYTLHITGRLLHVSGCIDFNNGLLQIDGNYVERGDETGEDGKLKKSNGTLYFNDDNDRMIVGGDFYADSNYYGYFTAGTLQLKGNVTDCTGNTIRNTAGSQVTIFNGNGAQVVDLQTESACFNIVHTVNTNVRFKQLGIQKLDQNVTLTGDVTEVKNELNLQGNTLTINGNVSKTDSDSILINNGTLHITGNFRHANGKVDLNNGTLQVDGNYVAEYAEKGEDGQYKKADSTLYFDDDNDHMIVGGSFYANSNYYGYFTNGTLELKGNVTDCTGNTIRRTTGSQVTIFNGNGVQVVDLQTESACFNIVHTVNPRVRFKKIGIQKLDQDITLNGDVEDIKNELNLNGYSMTIYGNVTKKGGDAIEINGGKLHITGNFRHVNGKVGFDGGTLQIDGSYIAEDTALGEDGQPGKANSTLYMKNAGDHMAVGGNFKARSNYYGYCTNGVLEIKGDVADYTGNTIRASGTEHKTILNGPDHQSVDFSQSNNARFHILEITKARSNYTFNPDPCWDDGCLIQGSAKSVIGVSLDQTGLSLPVGRAARLLATISPYDAADQRVTWSTDAAGTASVDENGLVTGVSEGTATITVTTRDGSYTATCSVNVTPRVDPEPGPGPEPDPSEKHVTGISLDKTTLTLKVGETGNLTSTITPSDAADLSLKVQLVMIGGAEGILTDLKAVRSSETSPTCSITFTAAKVGQEIVRVVTNDGNKTADCTVTVTESGEEPEVPVSNVTLDQTSYELGVGETLVLSSELWPSNASNKTVKWTTSEDDKVYSDQIILKPRTVQQGRRSFCAIKGQKTGTATVTVSSEDGSHSATCSITVVDYSYDVHLTKADLNKEKLNLEVGEKGKVTATLAPDNADDMTVWWTYTEGTEGVINHVTKTTGTKMANPSFSFTAEKAGSATIYMTTLDGGIEKKCEVTVTGGDDPDPSGVPVTNVTLDKKNASICVGEAIVLTSTIWPSNVSNTNVNWTTSEDDLPYGQRVLGETTTRQQGGCLNSTFTGIAKKPGTVTVTAASENGKFQESCVVTVVNDSYSVHVSGIKLNKTKLSVKVGDTAKLTATVSPKNADDLSVYWTHFESNVAVFNNTKATTGTTMTNPTFEFTAEKAGTATVWVTTLDGGLTAQCEVTVTDPNDSGKVKVKGISLDKTSMTLKVGQTGNLTSTILPENADNTEVTWNWTSPQGGVLNKTKSVYTTGDPVSTYSFKAEKAGKATITVKTADGGYTASCVVTVKDDSATPSGGDGYTFWGESETVNGDTLTVTLLHTDETVYDGRKHVVGKIGSKRVTETASVNPDIEVLDFSVTLGGEEVPGISIKSFNYKNNQLPSDDGVTDQKMYIYPVVSYDSKDKELKEILSSHPAFKSKLSQMLKPTINRSTGKWTYDPIEVAIRRITLSESTPVYTASDLASSQTLKETDGILVWAGTPSKNILVSAGKNTVIVTKVNIKGLYYQKVFSLPNGKKAVKKINLRPGNWNVITKTYTVNGKKVTEYAYEQLKSTNFDYIPPYEYKGTPGKMPAVILNGDDADWSSYNPKAKRGNFTGTLPVSAILRG